MTSLIMDSYKCLYMWWGNRYKRTHTLTYIIELYKGGGVVGQEIDTSTHMQNHNKW